MTSVIEFPTRVVERVHTEIVVDPLTGCHLSTLSTHSDGYSQIGWSDNGKVRHGYGHRIVWITANGPIPDGLVVDHRCYTRKCVNLEHLRLLPLRANSRRKKGLGDWPLGQCANGHPDSMLRTVASSGKRRCGACWDAEQKASELRRRRECIDCGTKIDRKATRCSPCYHAVQRGA